MPPPVSLPTSVNSSPPSPLLSSLNFLQLNCNGIRGKHGELVQLLSSLNVHVAALQETKLRPSVRDPKFPCYSIVRCDRPSPSTGGGLAFLVHETIRFTVLPPCPGLDNFVECQGISINTKSLSDLNIFNVYVPPSSPEVPSSINLSSILGTPNSLVLGDFNAHNPLWLCPNTDVRGTLLADQIEAADLFVLNNTHGTRLPVSQSASSPDISLAPIDLALELDWQLLTTFQSDHLPILITHNSPPPHLPKKSFQNFNKANWSLYRDLSDEGFEAVSAPTSVDAGEAEFRAILLRAARRAIPSGNFGQYKPGIDAEVRRLIEERDTIRLTDSSSPELHSLNLTINKTIDNNKKERWRDFISSIDPKTESSKLWKTIKKLNNSQTSSINHPISFNNKQYTKPLDIASRFNDLFNKAAPLAPPPHSFARQLHRSIRKSHALAKEAVAVEFDPSEVAAAIDSFSNSKAAGPDGLNILHLKHLGPRGLDFLTGLLNLSLATASIPRLWRKSVIIPLPKVQKPISEGSSYRPISLLCPAVKVLERLLLPILKECLQPAAHQHGFTAMHSTTSALLPLTTAVANGFNHPKPAERTVVAVLDLSKAFDSVCHARLISKISRSSLPAFAVRWVSSYLSGRSSVVSFRGHTSRSKNCRSGVPQGSVISPVLFNYFLQDIPEPPVDVSLVTYADDITVFASSAKIHLTSQRITDYLVSFDGWAKANGLLLSAGKSSVTLFTPSTREFNTNPNVILDGSVLPLVKNPKILGVTFDPSLTFNVHAKTIKASCARRTNILRALAGSSWGQDKETLSTTFKAFIRPVMNYACPVWFPNLKETHVKRLQASQNLALRSVLGCVSIASEQHIHEETRVLDFKAHSSLLCKQYRTSTRRPEHPSHAVLVEPAGRRRNMKQTLHSKFSGALPPPSPLTDEDYREAIRELHTDEVSRFVEALPASRVLGERPPPVAPDEVSLPRRDRSLLSQLRSGFSPLLQSYMSRLDPTLPSLCPKCSLEEHTTNHLFSCTMVPPPPSLTTASLWSDPCAAIAWIRDVW